MGIGKQPRTKALQQLSRRIKFQNRRICGSSADAGGRTWGHDVEAALEDPDVAAGVQMHPDDFSPVASVQAFWKRRPALDQAIRVGQLGWLGGCSLLSTHRRAQREDGDSAGGKHQSHATSTRHFGPPFDLRIRCGRIFQYKCPAHDRSSATRLSQADRFPATEERLRLLVS